MQRHTLHLLSIFIFFHSFAFADGGLGANVAHLLPTVNHERFLIKVSFRHPQEQPPVLTAGDRKTTGVQTDSAGAFWYFDLQGLQPDTQYMLQLLDAEGNALSAPWPLRTFPGPDTPRERFRVVAYMCAGGHPALKDPVHGGPLLLPTEARIRLLERALVEEPDALISIGDMVYWDLRAGRSAALMGASPAGLAAVGAFDRSLAVLGTENEEKLKLAVGPQIAEFYGTRCRSVPVFMVMDDHDYFENDHADNVIVTFPPDPFMLRLGRASQYLYYPEFLAGSELPSGLGGVGAGDRPPRVSESFGTLRYGALLELLFFDCRRYLTHHGETATFVPFETEEWAIGRLKSGGARHTALVPGAPFGWSAGKWAEWYPDILNEAGFLDDRAEKPFWQPGWAAQHDRMLAAARHATIPLIICGDLHSHAAGLIRRAGDWDLSDNPVATVLVGALGTGPLGWPSAFRNVPASPPRRITLEEVLHPVEQNGFTVIEFARDTIRFDFYAWDRKLGLEAIDTLEPFFTWTLKVPRA